MEQNFVIDTTAIISYFPDVFGKKPVISKKAIRIIERALERESSIGLSIPSIVFVELFDKWFDNGETSARIRYEIFEYMANKDNVEIKPIEQEVLEYFVKIDDDKTGMDNHDKIVLASAMMLNCPLITSDDTITKYVRKHGVIPKVIN